MRNRMITAISFFAALVLSCYLTDLYLKNNFYAKGESYWKGAGHILKEDLAKGLAFIIAREFLCTFFLFGFFFTSTGPANRRTLFRLLNVLTLVTVSAVFIYVLVKLFDVLNNSYDRQDRLTEIALTWLLRAAGFYIAYRWVKKTQKKQNSIQHILE